MEKPLLILGGGAAGLSAALSAAQSGTPVILVEKEKRLGGYAAQFCCKATQTCAYCGACIIDETIREVGENPLITVHLNTTADSLSQTADGFKAGLSGGGDVEACAVVAATGFSPFDPKKDRSATAIEDLPDIVSAVEIEKMLREEGRILRPSTGAPPKSVAFIQCVGSRSRRFGSPECSRVCCPYAIRIARRIKWQQPDCSLTVFHMDLQAIRKIAFDMYREFAGEIEFVRGIPAEAVAGTGGGVTLKYEETSTGETKKSEFDMVVLSVGIGPHDDASSTAELLGLERGYAGFFKPASALQPHLTGIDGLFMAGTCSGPKDIKDCVAQGRAAARAALNWIQGKET
jgi:heterodisulfide reductase subunit A